MVNIPLGEAVAERRLEFRTPSGAREILVRLGRPLPDPEPGGQWVCPVELAGSPVGGVRAAHGEDSMQALLLALQLIDIELRHLRRATGATLTWLESEDVGFPNLFAMP